MYRSCIFCYGHLGANEAIEHFPVGRRLAFDPAKGRLWVVCPGCRRWNLTPLEERWEAIEECERAYRGAPERKATDQIGLARVPDGTELVRIGRPPRAELVAWRYGEQFRRRRTRSLLIGAGIMTLGAVISGGASAAGIAVLGSSPVWLGALYTRYVQGLLTTRLWARTGETFDVDLKAAAEIRVVPSTTEHRWALRVPLGMRHVHLHGDDAVRAVASVMPRLNHAGGGGFAVEDAVRVLERAGNAQALLGRAMWKQGTDRSGKLGLLEKEVRLALEMATHEEREERAMDGELEELESAWRIAEEVAAIADNLLLPASIEDFLRRHRPHRRS